MSDFVLYNYFRSSTSYRVRIAMNVKGLRYTYKPVHLLKDGGEQNSPDYRRLNPTGGVPTLVHKGHAVAETMAIMEYLDQICNEPRLFPVDPIMGAKVRQFCETINSGMHAYGNLKTLQYLEKTLRVTEEQKVAWVQHWLQGGFQSLETQAKANAGRCTFGDAITAADLFLIPQIFTAKRFNFDFAKYPTLIQINERLEKMDVFRSAHPYRQMDTPDDLRIQ